MDLRFRAEQVVGLLAALEREQGCDSRKVPGGFDLRVPGWDSLPFGAGGLSSRFFWERAQIRVLEDGTARFRWLYGTRFHQAMHAALLALFALGAGGDPEPGRLGGRLALLAFANLLPYLAFRSWAELWTRRTLLPLLG